jgi:hypothetical protein
MFTQTRDCRLRLNVITSAQNPIVKTFYAPYSVITSSQKFDMESLEPRRLCLQCVSTLAGTLLSGGSLFSVVMPQQFFSIPSQILSFGSVILLPVLIVVGAWTFAEWLSVDS